MATWREDIIKALEHSGGEARLTDIYALVKSYRGVVPPSYDAMIRGSIEAASSDSEVWHKQKGKPKDLFYSVDGIGGGKWGLRSMQGQLLTNSQISMPGLNERSEDEQPNAGLPKAKGTKIDTRSRQRLPAEDFEKITAEHIWNAIQKLLSGYSDHEYGESTDFDLLTDEQVRLPPKAVFGLAASEALGFAVLPKHFSGGAGTPCFRILSSAGYAIIHKVPQLATDNSQHGIVNQTQAKYWIEGTQKAAIHIRKERKSGLASAKKAQYRRLHGKLKCEECGLDPIATYGEKYGEASIEVHHRKTQVKDMEDGHITVLEDLQCICANCHRVIHKALKFEVI